MSEPIVTQKKENPGPALVQVTEQDTALLRAE